MHSRLLSVSVLLVPFLLPSPSLQAQDKVSPLGSYDFYHYYEYQELTDFLTEISEAFPDLTHLESMAESQMGREVWMMTINNPATGRAEDKPGIFLNQIHAGEVIASTSNLYTIWYLLDNYGKDEQVTDLVDHNVWYIVPRLDVDGAEAYLTGTSPRLRTFYSSRWRRPGPWSTRGGIWPLRSLNGGIRREPRIGSPLRFIGARMES